MGYYVDHFEPPHFAEMSNRLVRTYVFGHWAAGFYGYWAGGSYSPWNISQKSSITSDGLGSRCVPT